MEVDKNHSIRIEYFTSVRIITNLASNLLRIEGHNIKSQDRHSIKGEDGRNSELTIYVPPFHPENFSSITFSSISCMYIEIDSLQVPCSLSMVGKGSLFIYNVTIRNLYVHVLGNIYIEKSAINFPVSVSSDKGLISINDCRVNDNLVIKTGSGHVSLNNNNLNFRLNVQTRTGDIYMCKNKWKGKCKVTTATGTLSGYGECKVYKFTTSKSSIDIGKNEYICYS